MHRRREQDKRCDIVHRQPSARGDSTKAQAKRINCERRRASARETERTKCNECRSLFCATKVGGGFVFGECVPPRGNRGLVFSLPRLVRILFPPGTLAAVAEDLLTWRWQDAWLCLHRVHGGRHVSEGRAVTEDGRLLRPEPVALGRGIDHQVLLRWAELSRRWVAARPLDFERTARIIQSADRSIERCAADGLFRGRPTKESSEPLLEKRAWQCLIPSKGRSLESPKSPSCCCDVGRLGRRSRSYNLGFRHYFERRGRQFRQTIRWGLQKPESE